MAALAPVPADFRPAAVQRIAAFLAGFSVEATRPSPADIAALDVLPRGSRVYISAVPGRPFEECIAAAIRLRAAGLEPTPHIAVRNFSSADALDDFLARLNGEAGVRSALVIAGDRNECGPFRAAIDVIDSSVLRRRGLRSIGIAGYPQGHPRSGDDALRRAMADKIAAGEATGLAVEIVTQFCFDARAIVDYVTRLRAFGFEHPVRVGIAGPTGLGTLLRYAQRCGVHASAHALTRRAGLIRKILTTTGPDDVVRALADAALGNVSAHFFSFGGLPATARWARAAAEGCIALDLAGGFTISAPAQTI